MYDNIIKRAYEAETGNIAVIASRFSLVSHAIDFKKKENDEKRK